MCWKGNQAFPYQDLWLKLLFSDSKVDPFSEDNYAIRSAAHYGHNDVAKLLFSDLRVDLSDDDNYAFRKASQNVQSEIVKLLLKFSRVTNSCTSHQCDIKIFSLLEEKNIAIISER